MDIVTNFYLVLLPAAIAGMWLYFKQKSDSCEKDRRQLWQAVGKLTGIAYAVRSCPVATCGLRDQATQALEPDEEDLAKIKQQTLKELGIKNNDVICYHVQPQQ